MDKKYRFTQQNETVNLEDSNGRAVWVLGYLLSVSDCFPEKYKPMVERTKFVFTNAVKAMEDVQSLRAMAFIIKGLYFYNQSEGREWIHSTIEKFAD